MKIKLLLSTLVLLFSAAAGTLKAQQLAKIETYKSQSSDAIDSDLEETYDRNVASQRPVPPTLTDVFIWDVLQRVKMDLKLEIKPAEVTEEIIKKAFDVYLKNEWTAIAGYRPWTHSVFIRSLTPEQLKTLTAEVVVYIKANGVKEMK